MLVTQISSVFFLATHPWHKVKTDCGKLERRRDSKAREEVEVEGTEATKRDCMKSSNWDSRKVQLRQPSLAHTQARWGGALQVSGETLCVTNLICCC